MIVCACQGEEKEYYLLLIGADSCHDADEWLGIYESIGELHRAYEFALRETEAETGTRLMIYAFTKGKAGSRQSYMEVMPEELWDLAD